MSDLIDRRAAIDATWFEPSYTDPLNVLTEVRDRLKELPSAQPDGPDNLVKDSQGLAKDLVNDCISRRAVIDATWFEPSYTDPLNVLTEVRDRLKELPSAQPERKRGKWKKISPASIYECSVCGQTVMTDDIEAYSYCHGCGVKMEVSE